MPEIEIRIAAPVEIGASGSSPVLVDVSNKAINAGSLSANTIITILGYVPDDVTDAVARWNNFVQLDNVTTGDVLVHNGSTFTNQAKENLSDGGNF